MTVAVIALAVALVGSLGLNGWLTAKAIAKTEAKAEVDVEQGATLGDLDRERDRRQQAERVLELMKEEVRHAATRAPIGAGLALDDVATRLDRLWAGYSPAAAAAADDHGGPTDAVPDAPGAVAGGGPSPAGAGVER